MAQLCRSLIHLSVHVECQLYMQAGHYNFYYVCMYVHGRHSVMKLLLIASMQLGAAAVTDGSTACACVCVLSEPCVGDVVRPGSSTMVRPPCCYCTTDGSA